MVPACAVSKQVVLHPLSGAQFPPCLTWEWVAASWCRSSASNEPFTMKKGDFFNICIKSFSVWTLPPIQRVLKTAAAMSLDACRPLCFCLHMPANVPLRLGVCVAVAAPWALFQWMCCLCVCMCMGGCTHVGSGHPCGVQLQVGSWIFLAPCYY